MIETRDYRAYKPRPPRVWSGLSPAELVARLREMLVGGRIPPRYLLWEAIDVIERANRAMREPQ